MQTHSTHSNDVRIFMQKIMEEAKIQCNVATDLQFLILIRSSSEHVVKRHPSRDFRIDFAVTCCWRVNYAAAPSLDVGRRRSGTPLCQKKQARCQFHPLHIMDILSGLSLLHISRDSSLPDLKLRLPSLETPGQSTVYRF